VNILNIPLVYIAGPFSAPTREGVEANIAAAVQVGLDVAALGACPVVPHSNTAHPEFELLQGYEFWIAATKRKCRTYLRQQLRARPSRAIDAACITMQPNSAGL
jgi:hypothetical protein